MTNSEDSGLSTRAVHAGMPDPVPGAPVVAPIVPASTFYTDESPDGEVLYTRYGRNPNHEIVGAKIAALEGAEAGLVLASGMAAISLTLLSYLQRGDHVVAQRELYGGTLTLLRKELPRFGIETTFVGDDEWESAIRPETRVLLAETPVNPTLDVTDLRALGGLARARGIPLVVDSTFATPINLRPLEHGASAVVHSATKYLGGHSDLTAGVVAGSAELIESVRTRMKSFGAVLDPVAAWLLDRGMKTLAVRVARQNETSLALAQWLTTHPQIERVLHPGLLHHPAHARARDLLDGFGGMLSIVVRGGDDAALRALARLRLIRPAPSLGGVESLASMPRFTSHAAMTPEERRARGILDGFVRISVGLEDFEDLRRDLDAALSRE